MDEDLRRLRSRVEDLEGKVERLIPAVNSVEFIHTQDRSGDCIACGDPFNFDGSLLNRMCGDLTHEVRICPECLESLGTLKTLKEL